MSVPRAGSVSDGRTVAYASGSGSFRRLRFRLLRTTYASGFYGPRTMIWFPCKTCGKKHKRPDEAAGSLVFCSCGEANRVPWESTTTADEVPTEAPPAPATPPAAPASGRVEEEWYPPQRRR